MPQKSVAADAFGVVTICLVAILIVFGVLCIVYSCYFRSRVRSQGFHQLSFFSGPWIIRIIYIVFVIWWGFGEIIRLSLLRRKGRLLNALDVKWHETVCKGYIISSLGFAEPCLLLTLVFLLRAPLQKMESGILGQKWNQRTLGTVLLCCLPVFALQLVVILAGPRMRKDKGPFTKLPHYFTSTSAAALQNENTADGIALCTYPLLNTILIGVFATALTLYIFYLGRRLLKLVINKGLQKRVYTLVLSVSSFLPIRVVLLGLSVLSKPEHVLFEALVFSAFLALLCCAGVCILMLVYCPAADSLALGNPQDLEDRRTIVDHNETVSLIANQGQFEENSQISPSRNSDESTKRGSISFRTYQKDGTSSGQFVELSLFSPSHDVSLPGSPNLLGWPMRPSIDPKTGTEQHSW